MKVSQLAKDLNITSDAVLKTLKSMKLKAKDSKQELSAAVVSIIKSELKKPAKSSKASSSDGSKKAESKKEEPKKEAKKKVVKKKTEKKDEKVTTKKKVVKRVKKVSGKVPKDKDSKVIKKKVVKKKAVVTEQPKVKPKSKISREPLITLKPLSRKKRKSSKEDPKTAKATEADEVDVINQEEGQVKLQPQAEENTVEKEVEVLASRDEDLPDLEINVPITVKDLSTKLSQKPSVVLTKLMRMGVMTNINQWLDATIVSKLTQEFGFNYAKIRTQEEQVIELHQEEDDSKEDLLPRAPVVTFMGHVDHGKTSLLDRIRKTQIVDREHGGITQHIGAYSVELEKGKITFLDTPGHEAFTAMRARGAHITDIVVLVVAADEGIKPQTEEAIDHARAAGVPIVVALNKIDRENADLDRVKKELADHDLAPEDWGGKTIMCGVSAITGEGVEDLLEMILLEAEILELKANAKKKASGIIVEAHLSGGKGVVATLIVQSGTLRDGDFVIVGPHYGKVKKMFDDHNRTIKEAGPSTAIEVLGLPEVPAAGEMFYVVDSEKQAKDISFKRLNDIKDKKMGESARLSLEDIYSKIQEGSIKELSVILKADVQGSLEALKDSLEKIPSDKVKIRIIHQGVGEVNASDVLLAVASSAIIIAFHVDVDQRAQKELEKEPVDIRQYKIIYDAVNDMRKALEGLLEVKKKKIFLSKIEIRQVFKLSKSGIVAGCYVSKGKVHRKANVDILRDDEVVYTGVITTLKRFKDDVKDVTEGMECGIAVHGFDKYQVGDIIEAYDLEDVHQTL